VSAPGVSDGEGGAFVYELSDDGLWKVLATITAPDTAGSFGETMAISGNHVAIGAPDKWNETGEVYVYSLPDMNETILHYIGNGTDVYSYGSSLDLFADILIVGAPAGDNNLLIYKLNQGAWNLVGELPSPYYTPSVATDGSTIVAGHQFYPSKVGGGAFVYGSVAPVTGVDVPAASPTSDIEGDTGTEGQTGIKTEGDSGTEPEGEAGTGAGKNETGTEGETEPSKSPSASTETENNNGSTSNSTPARSSASTPCNSLLNIILLTVCIAHLLPRTSNRCTF